MAGTTAAPATGLYSGGTGVQNTSLTQSQLNNFRISAVIDRMLIHLYNNSKNHNEFENLCLSLASFFQDLFPKSHGGDSTALQDFCVAISRGIDHSIANFEAPNRSRELPSLVKQVCQMKNDNTPMQAAIMVLMISVKSACQSGWFSDQDSEELINLAKKVASNFCSTSDFNAEPNPSHPVISIVMSRYYPRLRMGHIFVFLEVKPGFDAYVSDFQITKKKCTPGDKIRLLVVQTDNIETSSCLVTPAKVNFLLDGKGVERRTNLFADTGPQVPTVVTPLLKYGSNLLQAVGEFNGNYIIIVAFMSDVPNPDSNTLQNCEQHAPATMDADSEVIEGSSRVSLNCPISFTRIKTPVKGLSCKHIQCFDFDNYVDINSRRPSWRCPLCNQHVCFSDIRIDQKMVKILKEVGPNVSDVIVSSDGLWNAVMESDETTEKPEDKTSNTGQDESPQPGDILDLTQTDDPMDILDASGTEDRKHSSMANARTTTINPHLANTNVANQSSSHIDNDSWAGIYMSTLELVSPNVRPNVQTTGFSASTSNLTESFTSTNREVGAFHHNTVTTTSAPQTGTPLPQYQLYQVGNSPVLSDYGSRPSAVPRHITRTASAVQALPAQTTAAPILQRSSSANAASSPFTPNGLSAASQASPAAPNLTTNRVSPHQVPPSSYSSLLSQHTSIQQNHQFPSARPSQQSTGFLDPNQVPNMYRVSNEHQSSTQPTNFRISRPTSQSPGVIQSSVQPSTSLMRPQSHAGVASTQQPNVHRTGVATQQDLIATANRAAQMSVGASRAVPSYSWNTGAQNTPTLTGDQRVTNRATPPPQPVTIAQSSADQNWRPTSRMRGALVGQDYEEAFNRFIKQPTQQAQAARPISNPTPLPNNVRPNLQTFMSGGNVQVVRSPNSASAAPFGRSVGPDTLPNGSS